MRVNLTVGSLGPLASYSAANAEVANTISVEFYGTGLWVYGEISPSFSALIDGHAHIPDPEKEVNSDTGSVRPSPLILGVQNLHPSFHKLVLTSEHLTIDHVISEVDLLPPGEEIRTGSLTLEDSRAYFPNSEPLSQLSRSAQEHECIDSSCICFTGQSMVVYGDAATPSVILYPIDVPSAPIKQLHLYPPLGHRSDRKQKTHTQKLLYSQSELKNEIRCVHVHQTASFMSSDTSLRTPRTFLEYIDLYSSRPTAMPALYKRSGSVPSSSSTAGSLGLLIGLPITLGFVLLALLFLYWYTRRRTPKMQENPTPFLQRAPSTQKSESAYYRGVAPSFIHEHKSMADTFSDEPFLDMKDGSFIGTIGSVDCGYQLRRDALLAFRCLETLPPPSPPPKPAPKIPLPPIPIEPPQLPHRRPRQRTSSWARIKPDLQALKNKASLSTISFARSRRNDDVPPDYILRPPFWASIPPLILSTTSPSSPARIRPLPPLPTPPITPATTTTPSTPASVRRPLLPNRLGEFIVDPDRIMHEQPRRTADTSDDEVDLLPPPYCWHRAMV